MTATNDDLARKLSLLRDRADDLRNYVHAYQTALINAREAGASWPELAKAASIGIGAVRSRHNAAQHGGELHIQIPAPRREN